MAPSVEEYCRLLDKVKADYTENITRLQAKNKLKRVLGRGSYPKSYTPREKIILGQVGFPPSDLENTKWSRTSGLLANFKKVFQEKKNIPRKELINMLVSQYGEQSYDSVMNFIARAKKGDEAFGFRLAEFKKVLYKRKLGRVRKSRS